MCFLPFTASNTNVVEVAGYTQVGGLHQKRHTVQFTSFILLWFGFVIRPPCTAHRVTAHCCCCLSFYPDNRCFKMLGRKVLRKDTNQFHFQLIFLLIILTVSGPSSQIRYSLCRDTNSEHPETSIDSHRQRERYQHLREISPGSLRNSDKAQTLTSKTSGSAGSNHLHVHTRCLPG